MYRSSHGSTGKDKSQNESNIDWCIGVGDARRASNRSLSRYIEASPESPPTCNHKTTRWIDLFRVRYRSWTANRRESSNDLTSSNPISELRRFNSQNRPGTGSLENRRPSTAGVLRKVDSFSSPRLSTKTNLFPKKTIYFIRHGTAFCNTCRCTRWMEDQRLTPTGWQQVSALGSYLATLPSPEVQSIFIIC